MTRCTRREKLPPGEMAGIDRDRELLFEELPLTFPCVVQAGKIPEATFSNRSVYIYIYMRLYSSRNVHSLWNGGKPSGGGIKMEHNGIDIEPVNAYIWSYTKIISIGTKGGAWALFAVGGERKGEREDKLNFQRCKNVRERRKIGFRACS